MSLTTCCRSAGFAAGAGGVGACDRSGDIRCLRWLIRRIAADDRGAFAELFHRVSGPMSDTLRGQLADPVRVAGVVAGTFVEVWWLAGAHVDPDTDVTAWINQIIRRRVHDSRPPVVGPAHPAGYTADMLTCLWAQRAEVELAGLLRPHRSVRSCCVPVRRGPA